jgi:hypothetical protein
MLMCPGMPCTDTARAALLVGLAHDRAFHGRPRTHDLSTQVTALRKMARKTADLPDAPCHSAVPDCRRPRYYYSRRPSSALSQADLTSA